jgi:hypothetical protein
MHPFTYNFILVLLIILLAGCENDIEKVKLITAQKEIPIETATGLEIIYSDSAK